MDYNMEGKYQSSIENLPILGNNRYENIFKLYQTEDKEYYYNLKTSITFPSDIDDIYIDSFTLDRNVPWTIISYNIYGSIFLWWCITELNKISNPVILPKTGTVIKYIKPQYIKQIVSQINNNG
tara:strand:+ start:385 stop:756 length:372 start_codon:yes stop_codon:yes gene_type:complete